MSRPTTRTRTVAFMTALAAVVVALVFVLPGAPRVGSHSDRGSESGAHQVQGLNAHDTMDASSNRASQFVTLEQARGVASIPFMVPSYTPRGFELDYVQVLPIGSELVMLFYRGAGPGEALVIIQREAFPGEAEELERLSDRPWTRVDVGGAAGLWMDGSWLGEPVDPRLWQSTRKQLTLLKDGLSIDIVGVAVTKDDMFAVARALKPAGTQATEPD